MTRLLTALVAVPLALAAVFWLSTEWFFLFVLLLVEVAVLEYARLGRRTAAGVPLWVLLLAVPPAALVLHLETQWWDLEFKGQWIGPPPVSLAFCLLAIVPLVFGAVALFSRAPLDRALSGLGLAAFGLPYFILPIAALLLLHESDPWLLFMLLGVVWVGDTFAYYFGTKWGRHKLAPVVSPHKSWEGAVAGMVGSLLTAVAFHLWRPEAFVLALLPLAAVTAVVAQVGDLVESLIKRAADVKDSSRLL
ncbi:MAG: phosphatidate cytidylyltransferase, partial [Thermoanaerobaculia bacterium]